MKKLFLMLTLILMSQWSMAQDKTLAQVDAINYYGIDYSLVKAFGAKETVSQFIEVFPAINRLILAEPNKYDLTRLGKRIDNVYLEGVNERNAHISPDSFLAPNPSYHVSDEAIAKLVASIETPSTDGVGVIFVAELLDKAANKAFFTVVFFDEASKKVLESHPASGRAQGFGLRNFWTYPVYQVLKNW